MGCGQSTTNVNAEPVNDEATTELSMEEKLNSRPPQTIEKFMARIEDAITLEGDQKEAILAILDSTNYASMTREQQRGIRENIFSQISAEILTKEQNETWEAYKADLRAKRGGN